MAGLASGAERPGVDWLVSGSQTAGLAMAKLGANTDRRYDWARVEELGRSGFTLAIQLMQNRDDAADAVQDALHALVRNRRLYDPQRGNVRAWFLKIVRNRCVDLLRRRGHRHSASGGTLDMAASPEARPDEAAEMQEELRLLRRELFAMSTDQREVILLRDYHNLSYAELATVLRIPVGTVMSRLHRARTELRRRMQRHFG
jgi:RNA polymerase sigma-70 factor (ECF subfamily)